MLNSQAGLVKKPAHPPVPPQQRPALSHPAHAHRLPPAANASPSLYQTRGSLYLTFKESLERISQAAGQTNGKGHWKGLSCAGHLEKATG